MIRCHDCEENPATTLVILHVGDCERRGALCTQCVDELREAIARPKRLARLRRILWALAGMGILLGIAVWAIRA